LTFGDGRIKAHLESPFSEEEPEEGGTPAL